MLSLSKETVTLLAGIVVLICKAIYATAIYKSSCGLDKWKQGLLSGSSLAFPIIAGIICTVKCNQGKKAKARILLVLVLTLGVSVTVVMTVSNAYAVNYYDAQGEKQFYKSDISFKDAKGNKYTFDFEKSGYDKLYINGTDKFLNADLCYLDKTGCLVYDEDMSITAKDEQSCVDKDGSVYYPAKFAAYNKDGSVNYSFNSSNFSYDRFGNAYTYSNVPFYDRDLNKYMYSFDSDTQKGSYTNVNTGEVLENEYCFVDRDGYLVYDKEHTFKGEKNEDGFEIYNSPDGTAYYWASSISWDKDGNLLDSFGNLLT